MISDKIFPIARSGGATDLEVMKPGQAILIETTGEMFVGSSQGNILINPKTTVKGATAPTHLEGLNWIELKPDGTPKYDFAWLSKGGKWVSATVYAEKLRATSQSEITVTALIDRPYFEVAGVDNSIFVEEMRLAIESSAAVGQPMGHNLISVVIGALDPFGDNTAIVKTVQGSAMAGPRLRKSFDMAEVVDVVARPVFGLTARAAAGTVAMASVIGALTYRLVRVAPVATP